ncbi:MAG: MarC family protein [Pseudomonadota bacterium]
MLELALTSFMTLFVIIDPPGNLPIFLSLTAGTPAAHQRAMAIKAPVIALCVLLVFALVGERLLSFIGIDMSAFRIAGGLMLLLVALEMVFEKTAQRKSDSAKKVHQRKLKAAGASTGQGPDNALPQNAADKSDDDGTPAVDVSVFPLAIPILAGPGAITTVLLLISQQDEGWIGTGVVLAVVVVLMALCMALFLLSSRLDKLLGSTVTNILTRLFGVILAALSIQFVIDGVKQAFDLTS